MTIEIRAIVEVIHEDAKLILHLLNALKERSGLEQAFGNQGGLTVISPSPYRWKPLDPSGIQFQAKIRTLYQKFCNLIRALLSNQPAGIQRQLMLFEEMVNQVVEQESRTAEGDISRIFDRAFTSVKEQVGLLRGLQCETAEAQLVPDTNALLFNPELEKWHFDIAGCSSFCLVFTPVVLGELDLMKADQRRGEEVRNKAARLIRQFGEYRRRGKVTEGVPLVKGVSTVKAIAAEPDFGRSLPWLSSTNNDDRLLAHVVDVMRANPLARVAIITRDMNLLNKAELAEVPALDPPDPTESLTTA